MKIILFDTAARTKLYPLTLTRAVADIRIGILTMKERWQQLTKAEVFVLTEPYLQNLYEKITAGEYIFIDASVMPTPDLIKQILSLKNGESLLDESDLIAGRSSIKEVPAIENVQRLFENVTKIDEIKRLLFPFQIFQWSAEMLKTDYSIVTRKKASIGTNDTVHTVKAAQIFVEAGATIDFSILNATDGPIYIGKDAVIMEGCTIRGPFAMGEGAVLKMGTKVYGGTTVGPYCTVGGEIKNSILMGYSNKGHDGYLGDSVIGEWCNMGAGTNNSNVKNTGGEVSLWDYDTQTYSPVGRKCGVIMGDYSRTAINTSINTGSVIGVCSNVFTTGLTNKFIKDFSWGCGGERYQFDKAIKDIDNWKKMKNKTLSEIEASVLQHIFGNTGK